MPARTRASRADRTRHRYRRVERLRFAASCGAGSGLLPDGLVDGGRTHARLPVAHAAQPPSAAGKMTCMPSTYPTRTRAVLEAEINRLATLIDASGCDVVGFDPHIDAAYPFIEVGADGLLHWIVKERGQVLEHRTTDDPEELLYWSFESTTFSLASRWEVRHRDETKDSRVGLWRKQADLLHRLKPTWAHRWRSELARRPARRRSPHARVAARPHWRTSRQRGIVTTTGRLELHHAPGRDPV